MINLQASLTKLEETLSQKSEETKKDLYKKLDLNLVQQIAVLNLNARIFSNMQIDLETSNFIYRKMSSYDSTTLAERIVLAELIILLGKIGELA